MTKYSPFSPKYKIESDTELIKQALEGSTKALDTLIKKHQDYIYNVALKLVMNPVDAEDITQEVLIKAITKLSQFKANSDFRTWLYRITFNHFLKMEKKQMEKVVTTFDAYGDALDSVVDVELSEEAKIEQRELIEEAKYGCMAGMLLCLSREQRLVYVIGEIFDADHNIGSEMLEISKANFRKRLERARKDLYQFMNKKCGLINKNNPCRCARKTSGFIKRGWVDKDNMHFNTAYYQKINQTINERNNQLYDLMEKEYAELFQDYPFLQKEHSKKIMATVVEDRKFKELLNLN